ncbi:MAG: ABC transporter permease subunit [Chloroflexota bacterium]|nr:ABC transporter permease subunit [Chloroflexota bacterium]MDE2929505.1 ABC transporter permease subunit [Chloroflexota bacterium]
MAEIFLLSLRQLLGRWRLIVILLLAALPSLLVLLIRAIGEGEMAFHGEFVGVVIDAMITGGIMPIVTMTLATAAFGNELEDKTLYFLVLKPVSRVSIVLAKLLAVLVVALPLVIASGVVASALVNAEAQQMGILAIALAAGVTAYASVFTLAGLLTPRALAYGLVYVLVWEGLLSTIVSGIGYLSVRGYTLALLHGMDESSFAVFEGRVIEFPAAIVGTVVVIAAFFLLALYRLRTMDVP